MASSAKTSIVSWWIMAIMAFFLWYRNLIYDRILAVFVLMLGVGSLLEYAIYSGANVNQVGKAMFLSLWLQCLVLAIGVYVILRRGIDSYSTRNQLALVTIAQNQLLFFLLIFVVAFFTVINDTFEVTAAPNSPLSWRRSQGTLLGNWWWLYLLGIAGPLLLLVLASECSDVRLILLLAYSLAASVYVYLYFPGNVNVWCYLGMGLAFLAWILGDPFHGLIKNK